MNEKELKKALEDADPRVVDAAFAEYYNVSRKDMHGMQRIWIQETRRPVKDFYGISGTRYFIYTPEMGFPTARANGLRKAYDAVIADMPLQSIVHSLSTIKGQYDKMMLTREGASDLGHTIVSAQKAMESYNRKWHMAVEAATFFIIAEDEDLGKWDERKAVQKMEDWGLVIEEDFFFCCTLWGVGLNARSDEFFALLMSQEAKR